MGYAARRLLCEQFGLQHALEHWWAVLEAARGS
jgi:hypothetical protein